MRSYTKNNSRQEAKKEVEEHPNVETKPKKKTTKKVEEQIGETWEEKQES